ncbi:MAG: hypothetical protein SVU32_02045, partial [Candidatus Nanohaloarchaea archaeon]|nr:hypothetical protein [Candidatus Nanohaloarchaea archaeon]
MGSDEYDEDESGFTWGDDTDDSDEYQNNPGSSDLDRWENDEEAREYLKGIWDERDRRGKPAYDTRETLLSDVLQDVDLFQDRGSDEENTQAGASVWRERSMSPDKDTQSDTDKYRMMKQHIENYLQEHIGDIEVQHDGDTYQTGEIAETVAGAFYRDRDPSTAVDLS